MLLKIARKALASVAAFAAMLASAGAIVMVPADRSAHELSKALQDFLDGQMTALEWGAFITQPIKDPALEEIRSKAMPIEIPLDSLGRATLRELVVELDAMIDNEL